MQTGRLIRVLLIGHVIAAAGACGTEPGDIGLSYGITIYGTVTRDGLPVPQVEVRSYGFFGNCLEPDGPSPAMITDSEGRFRRVITGGLTPPGTTFCFVFRALFDRDGALDSVTVRDVPITVGKLGGPRFDTPVDSARVDIALPP